MQKIHFLSAIENAADKIRKICKNCPHRRIMNLLAHAFLTVLFYPLLVGFFVEALSGLGLHNREAEASQRLTADPIIVAVDIRQSGRLRR